MAGALHVLSGPDHLAAVAPLAAQDRKRSWVTGLRWGLGHTSGVIVVGILSLLLREILPIELLSSWAERLVGIVLIGIGIWGVRKAMTTHVHAHEHTHDGNTHVHIHVHDHKTAHAHGEKKPHRHTHTAFAVGTLHGLAGSSHFLGVLPALAFPTKTQALIYLATYGMGTVIAMISFSSVVGLFARGFALKGARAYQTVMYACSIAAMAVGVYWLVV